MSEEKTQTPLELATKHNCIVVESPCDCGILGPSYIERTDVDDGRKKAIQFSCCGAVVEYRTDKP